MSLHIGLYSPVWPPGAVANGIATYTRIVRDELHRQGHRVTVFSGDCETNAEQGVVRVGSARPRPLWRKLLGRVQRLLGRTPPGYLDHGREIAAAVRQVHRRDPLDVFEMEESFGWCRDVAGRVPVPVVVKLHGPAFLSLMDGQSASPERLQRVRLEGLGLRAADALVAPSASTLADTLAHYGLTPADAQVLPNPVDEAAAEWLWRLSDREADHIVCVGRFDYRKGADLAIQAFLALTATRPALRLSLVGPGAGLPGPDGRLLTPAEYLAQQVPADWQGRIRAWGAVDLATVQALRARAALVLVSSRWESFGYAVAEAMMQGCPVVGLDVPGVNELIAHNATGLLAPPDQVAVLAAHMGQLLDHPDHAAALGMAARAAVLQSCGAPAVVARMVSHFSRLRGPASSSTRAASAAGGSAP